MGDSDESVFWNDSEAYFPTHDFQTANHDGFSGEDSGGLKRISLSSCYENNHQVLPSSSSSFLVLFIFRWNKISPKKKNLIFYNYFCALVLARAANFGSHARHCAILANHIWKKKIWDYVFSQPYYPFFPFFLTLYNTCKS